MHHRAHPIPALILCFTLAATAAVASGGSRSTAPRAPEPAADPIAEAQQHYDMGLSNRNKAWKLEKQLEDGGDVDRAKIKKKIAKQYKRAISQFRLATGKNSQHHAAFSDLGYCLRKTGAYEGALGAYERALVLSPGYSKAIEYRAEAYLGLNRIEDAKSAYVQLFGSDREEAAKLMEAMKTWVETRRGDPGDIGEAAVESFGEWVSEREALAGKTASLSDLSHRKW